MGRIAPRSGQNAGFSLPELLVVLGVVGILAGLFAPRVDVAKFRQDSAILEVSTALIVAQQKAVLRGHRVRVGFDTAASRLIIHEDADNDRAVSSGEDVRVVELGEGVVFGLGGAQALNSVPFDFTASASGIPTLGFSRNGGASQEGTIYLTSRRAQLSSSFPQDARALKLERSTGHVTCYSNRSGAWKAAC